MAAVAITDLPAGSLLFVVQNSDGTWPNRITARTDVLVVWIRTVTGSGDPASAAAPSVVGAYGNDITIGA